MKVLKKRRVRGTRYGKARLNLPGNALRKWKRLIRH